MICLHCLHPRFISENFYFCKLFYTFVFSGNDAAVVSIPLTIENGKKSKMILSYSISFILHAFLDKSKSQEYMQT